MRILKDSLWKNLCPIFVCVLSVMLSLASVRALTFMS